MDTILKAILKYFESHPEKIDELITKLIDWIISSLEAKNQENLKLLGK